MLKTYVFIPCDMAMLRAARGSTFTPGAIIEQAELIHGTERGGA